MKAQDIACSAVPSSFGANCRSLAQDLKLLTGILAGRIKLNSAYTLRMLNRQHSTWANLLLGTGAWLTVLLGTFDVRMASLARDLLVTGNWLVGVRVTTAILRLAGLPVFRKLDRFYYFPAKLDRNQNLQLLAFVRQRQKKTPSNMILMAAQAMIEAALVDGDVGEGAWERAAEELAGFEQTCNSIITAHNQPVLDVGLSKDRKGPAKTAGMDRCDAFQALADFDACCKRASLPWHVISGTFLGLVREGDFLAHDNDIDVGVYATEVSVEDVKLAVESGAFTILDFTEVVQYHIGSRKTVCKPGYIKLLHGGGVQVDIFFMHRDGDALWQGSAVHKWVNTFYDVKPYVFRGIEVQGPADADTYLTENYGDWRTPKLDFSCAVDTPHASVLANAGSISLFLTRIAYGMTSLEFQEDALAIRELLAKEWYIDNRTNRIDLRLIEA